MDKAVATLERHGYLVRAAPRSSYRLFLLVKNEHLARIIYDLSPLTPHLRRLQSHLPRPVDLLASQEPRVATKVDLRHGFFHVPLAPGLRQFMGVELADGRRFVWTVLTMGFATAPAIMQTVMGAVARLVSDQCPDVSSKVYLDDYLFVSCRPNSPRRIPALLQEWGLRISYQKSVLVPTSRLTYLDLDLSRGSIGVAPALQERMLNAVRMAPQLTLKQAQRLAGYIRFVRPVSRLPLQLVIQVLRRDPALPRWVDAGLLDHKWTFTSDDYDT